jgi:hypothetical protein
MNIIGSLLFVAMVFASTIISALITYTARVMFFGAKMSAADGKILLIIFASVFAVAFVAIPPVDIFTGKRKEKEDGF